jgi:hypothetical protein
VRRNDKETAESRLWRCTAILAADIATYFVDGPELDVKDRVNTTAATTATPQAAIKLGRFRTILTVTNE